MEGTEEKGTYEARCHECGATVDIEGDLDKWFYDNSGMCEDCRLEAMSKHYEMMLQEAVLELVTEARGMRKAQERMALAVETIAGLNNSDRRMS